MPHRVQFPKPGHECEVLCLDPGPFNSVLSTGIVVRAAASTTKVRYLEVFTPCTNKMLLVSWCITLSLPQLQYTCEQTGLALIEDVPTSCLRPRCGNAEENEKLRIGRSQDVEVRPKATASREEQPAPSPEAVCRALTPFQPAAGGCATGGGHRDVERRPPPSGGLYCFMERRSSRHPER
jgi:hypothetical protein